MIVHNLNPVLIDLGFFKIHYYSLFYLLGLAIAYYMILHMAKKKEINLNKEDVMDYIVYVAMGLLIGGRILYFVFYDLSALKDPLELFRLWNGGMSFHGGLLGAIIAANIFAKKKHINFYTIADLTAIPLALALAFGRIGNFVNGELYGRVWQGSLCIDYSQNPHINYLPKMCRYPSQFVESLKNIVIFTVLFTVKDKKLPPGTLFWLFVTMYGFLRFFIEFIREPDVQLGFVIGNFTMGQILSGIMFLSGIVMLLKRKK